MGMCCSKTLIDELAQQNLILGMIQQSLKLCLKAFFLACADTVGSILPFFGKRDGLTDQFLLLAFHIDCLLHCGKGY